LVLIVFLYFVYSVFAVTTVCFFFSEWYWELISQGNATHQEDFLIKSEETYISTEMQISSEKHKKCEKARQHDSSKTQLFFSKGIQRY
jgi:hypothetical protein